MRNKKNGGALAILPDARLMARYDEQIKKAEDAISSIRMELEQAGYEVNDMIVLASAFTPGWLADYEVRKLDGVDGLVKPLLLDMAKAKATPIEARIAELSKVVRCSSFLHDGEHYSCLLKPTDFQNTDGALKVKPEHREAFYEAHTRHLDEAEARVYNELCDIMPRLQAIKDDGWNITPLVVGRLGRFDFEKGVRGAEHLVEDVIKYRPIKRR